MIRIRAQRELECQHYSSRAHPAGSIVELLACPRQLLFVFGKNLLPLETRGLRFMSVVSLFDGGIAKLIPGMIFGSARGRCGVFSGEIIK